MLNKTVLKSGKFPRISALLLLFFFTFPLIGGCQDLNSGIEAYKKGEYDKAIGVLSDYLKNNPEDVEAHYYLGNSYFKKDLFDQALQEYQEVLNRKPKHTEALYQLGLVYLKKGDLEQAKATFENGLKIKEEKGWFYNGLGWVHMAEGDLAGADLDFRSAIAENPEVAEFHKSLGDVNFKKSVLPITIDEYKQALELDSTLVEAHFNLAEAYSLLKPPDFNGAVEELRATLRLKPDYKEAYLKLGNIYMLDRKHYAEAKAIYEGYIAIDSMNAVVHLNLGKAYYFLRDTSKAINHLTKAKELNPQEKETYLYLGMAYQENKQNQEALACYDEYQKLREKNSGFWSTKDADFWVRKGKLYLALGDSTSLVRGQEALAKAVELDSTVTGAFASMGYTLYKQGKYKDAIPYFKQTVDLKVGDPFNPLLYLAYCYLNIDDYAGAVEPLLKASEIQPENLEVRNRLGQVYYTLKDYPKAVEQLAIVLKNNPRDCSINAQYGHSLMLLKRYSEAISPLRKAGECYPKETSYPLLLAQALELTKNLDEAYEWYMKVLKMDPNNEQAKLGRDRIDMQRY